MSLDLNGPLNHGKLLLSIVLAFVAEALDGFECLFLASTAHKPPRGLGGEEDQNQEWSLDEVVISYCRYGLSA